MSQAHSQTTKCQQMQGVESGLGHRCVRLGRTGLAHDDMLAGHRCRFGTDHRHHKLISITRGIASFWISLPCPGKLEKIDGS